MTDFSNFGLVAPITRALAEENYTTPTPIQAATIPLALAGRDIVGIAQTGTGKTAAFALPILNRLAANPRRAGPKAARVLVLSPTRELANQTLDAFRTYGRHLRFAGTIAIGGVPMGRQVRALQNGVDVLVATPGRLLDLIDSRALTLGQIEVLVLDEADRMLDMGFIRDIRRIVAMLPKERQTLFFSATMPAEIASLAGAMLRDPARVAVTPVATTAERIDQRIIHVDRAGKNGLLVELLRGEPTARTIVFTRTKHGADKVVTALERAGIDAGAIHGNKSQGQRERVLAAFRGGDLPTLVATDIAARGIDVDGVSHVINYDLPNVPESYVHRIGRTARAGAEGIAISFCSADELAHLKSIERLVRATIPATRRPSAGRAPEAARPEAPARTADAPRGERTERQERHGERGRSQRNDGHRRPSQGKRRRRPMQGRGGNGARFAESRA